jgi:hypothetical protein
MLDPGRLLILTLQLAQQRLQLIRKVAFDNNMRGEATTDRVARCLHFLIVSHQPSPVQGQRPLKGYVPEGTRQEPAAVFVFPGRWFFWNDKGSLVIA